MSLNFESVPNWSFTQNDLKAKKKLSELRIKEAASLPAEHRSHKIILLFKELRATKLYEVLKTLPKGVVHHLHFDCCQDEDFYAQHVIPDPIVYLGKNLDSFCIGTKQQAEKEGWASMQQVKSKFDNEKEFIKFVSNLTMFSKEQIASFFIISVSEAWDLFTKKINNFFTILGALHLFKKYALHVFRKHIANGFDRIEFRAFLGDLAEYDEAGHIIKQHGKDKFMQVIDQACELVQKQHPVFSVGFIFFGLKLLKPEQNEQMLTEVLQKNWPKTIGIDFVQQEDPCGDQAPYDEIANRVLAKFPGANVKKVYHSGQTRNHLNRNVETSIKAGSVRIGHGINVIHHPHLMQLCREKGICFEVCPISNLIFHYVNDPRFSPISLLIGLGVPATINSDDPAKFGLEDTTMDYLITFLSSNWSLKHLKLLGIYSINHSICSEETKKQLIESFNQRWDKWVIEFISE